MAVGPSWEAGWEVGEGSASSGFSSKDWASSSEDSSSEGFSRGRFFDEGVM